MTLNETPLNTVPHRLLGRHIHSVDEIPYLFWSASGVEASFDGDELWILIETSYSAYEPWISVDIDGKHISRLGLEKGINTICLFRGMTGGTAKHVRILKETQFMHEDPEQSFRILGFMHGPGHFRAPSVKPLHFEFIGDSITSGEGAMGSPRHQDYCSWIFSVWNAYPRMVSDTFNADFSIVSQAGWGIVCDCENNPHCTIPGIYRQICGPATGKTNLRAGSQMPYDGKHDHTDAAIINLGTNDAAAFHAPAWHDASTGAHFQLHSDLQGQPEASDLTLVADAAKRLLRNVRSCNPSAQIIWCYGMLDRQLGPTLERAIRDYRDASDDDRVHYLPLPECAGDDIGACGHPGMAGHKHAARAIIQALRPLLFAK